MRRFICGGTRLSPKRAILAIDDWRDASSHVKISHGHAKEQTGRADS